MAVPPLEDGSAPTEWIDAAVANASINLLNFP